MTRKSFGFLFFCTCLTALFVMLGIWQIQRLHWKENLIRQMTERSQQTIIDLPLDQDWTKEQWNGRRVRVRGTYNDHDPLYLESKVLDGKAGYYVLSFLNLPDAGGHEHVKSGMAIVPYNVIVVNRGWIPPEMRGHIKTPQGAQTIEALVHYPPERKPNFVPPNELSENALHLFWVNLEEIRSVCCDEPYAGKSYPFYLDLVSSSPAAPDQPVPVNDRADLPNNHLQYATTWFALALITIVMSTIYFYRERNKSFS